MSAAGGVTERIAAGATFLAEWEAQQRGQRAAIDPRTFAELEELAGGDESFLDELLATYYEQAQSLVIEARAAAAAGRIPLFVRAVHTLNGSSRNVGALQVARLCTAIEVDSRTDASAPSLALMLDLIEEPLRTACAALRLHQQRAHQRTPG